MNRVRILVVWLILAALPLQGLAAASMLFCGMDTHHPTSQEFGSTARAPASFEAVGEHDHSHDHAGAKQATTSDDTSGAALPDASHKCGVCASCCYSVAIADFPTITAFALAPQADLAEPFVLIRVRPSPVPDKPPRA